LQGNIINKTVTVSFEKRKCEECKRIEHGLHDFHLGTFESVAIGSTACPYPGTTIGGTISLVKFYYSIGETVTFDCSLGLVLNGSRQLRCQKNGKWSAAIPTCIPATN